jgi:hypothetical protein
MKKDYIDLFKKVYIRIAFVELAKIIIMAADGFCLKKRQNPIRKKCYAFLTCQKSKIFEHVKQQPTTLLWNAVCLICAIIIFAFVR